MFHASKMVDMAQTPDEIAEDIKEAAPIAMPRSAPTYPYGLCISFDEEALEKLGLDGALPAVGQTFHFCAEARFTSVSQNERQTADGKTESCCRVEAQITQIGIPGASEADRIEQRGAARRDRLYGNAEADGED